MAGAFAGKLEVAKTSIDKAFEYAKKIFKKFKRDISLELPDFHRNYEYAKTMISHGHTMRKHMPVIDTKDIKHLQTMLKSSGIEVRSKLMELKNLNPIQQQVYLDKSLIHIAKNGANKSRSFVQSKRMIISKDNHILDGHHRYLSGMMNDPTMKVKTLEIHLPLSELLDLLTNYSDSVGNKRNS